VFGENLFMCAFQDRLNAIALGAVLAENLCMLLEFLSTRALQDLETEMIDKTLPAGASPRLGVAVCQSA
jgi:hypothetical protein